MSSPSAPAAKSPVAATAPDGSLEEPTADLDVDLDMTFDGAGEESSKLEVEETLDSAIVEPKEPTKKDISLREFITKMDDYAPIIPDAVTSHHLLLAGLDPATTPLPLQRLLALATQKFIADIAADAYQYSRMRASNTSTTALPNVPNPTDAAGGAGGAAGSKAAQSKEDKAAGKGHILGVQRPGYGGGGANAGSSSGKAVLTMEDLGCAVGEYGVNVKRGEFYR